MAIDTMPADHELIAFFASEPELTDPEVPWCYNHLRFLWRRGDDRVECEVAPGYESLLLRWRHGEQELVTLTLDGISGMMIEDQGAGEVLAVRFRDPRTLGLRLRLEPTVHLFWGMGDAGSGGA